MGVRDFFNFFRSWAINENVKKVCRNQVFFNSENNSRSKQNKKIPEYDFIDIGR